MRKKLLVLCLAFCAAGAALPAAAQLSIGFGAPGVSIGINVPVYPQLVRGAGISGVLRAAGQLELFLLRRRVLGLPGRQLVLELLVQRTVDAGDPEYVPAYVLRVPVRYYRAPPVYFRGWRANAPPRWDQHWGPQWSQALRDGTNGIGTQCRPGARFRTISNNIRATTIRRVRSSSRCITSTTATSRGIPRCSSTTKAMRTAPQRGIPQQGRPPGHAQAPPEHAQWGEGPQIARHAARTPASTPAEDATPVSATRTGPA